MPVAPPRPPEHAVPEPEETGLFPGFRLLDVAAGGVRFAGVTSGEGPPVVLLHGFPETHVAWHRIAPALAARFSVVVPDLPGYGTSRVQADQPRWTKRRMGTAVTALMEQLGHRRFAVVGHDRGARVGYRMALDYPGVVSTFASLTVVPTAEMWAAVDKAFAMGAFHWFLLAQPFDVPERLLASDPDAFLQQELSKSAGGYALDPRAVDAYRAAIQMPAVRHAMCEDYRAGAQEDAQHDEADRSAGRRLSCPVLILWPERPGIPRETPIDIWRRWADDVRGHAVPGAHLLPETSPREVLAALLPFLAETSG